MSDQLKKNGKSGRVKRKEVQTSGGWTIVTHSSPSSQKKGLKKNKGNKEAKDVHPRPTKLVCGLTVPKLLDEFKKLEARFQETLCAKQMDEILGKRKIGVKEAVCFGVGSFSVDWEHRNRSLWQLVLFRAVVKLVARNPASMKLYAQEPAFNALDKTFLRTLNITTVANNAEKYVGKNSFVFAPFVDWPFLLPVVMKGKDPELYVGNEIFDDYSLYACMSAVTEKLIQQCNGIGEKFLEGREGVRVPEFGLHTHALTGLMIYLRRQGGDVE
ncbi:hypothetical protein K469DRAFT_580765 [Zopfia rhizophila CBS 207.26]|uniref:SRR1-like domain-containing protein n=1 Tax=Zopfia rhizophila CBS 207.26 TaxID=1314779 RepID=A0A6A6E0L6_9PEZI|nr:hypothetical protein K469DRAFT_580765 [Zopfia rhizophila CBS 207.26]